MSLKRKYEKNVPRVKTYVDYAIMFIVILFIVCFDTFRRLPKAGELVKCHP